MSAPGRATKSPAEWREHWDARAQVGERVAAAGYCVAGRPLSPEQHEAVVARWLALLDLAPECAVLEVGFGPALILERLERLCIRVAGVDLSPEMVARYSGSAEVRVAEANALPFPRRAFDRVLMASVAHYFPDTSYLRASVAEFARVLRPGGFALLADILVAPPASGAPYLWYTREELEAAVGAAGCTLRVADDDPALPRVAGRIDVIVAKPAGARP